MVYGMYNRIRKALRNLQTMNCCVLLNKDSNYIIVQTALILNYSLELCKLYYIYCKDSNYQGKICEYREPEESHDRFIEAGNTINVVYGVDTSHGPNKTAPKMIDTIMSTISRLEIEYQDISDFSKYVTHTRNGCVHDIVEPAEGLSFSIFFYLEHIKLFIDVFEKLSKKFEFKLKNNYELIFKTVAEIASGEIENSSITSSESEQPYHSIYQNLLSQKYISFNDEDITNRLLELTTETEMSIDKNNSYINELESLDF